MYISTEDLVTLAQSLIGEAPSSSPTESSPHPAELLEAWYTVLLRQSLEFAEDTTPYHRDHSVKSGIRARSFERIGDLRRYPVFGRADFVGNYTSLFSSNAMAQSARSTSGTTGRRILVYGNAEEERAAAALRDISFNHAVNDRLLLRVIPGNRRTHIASGVAAGTNSTVTIGYSPAYSAGWFDHADHLIEILNDTYYLGGVPQSISLIHLTPPVILDYLTRDLRQRSADPALFAITDIALSGAFLSRQTRKLAEQVWKARVHHSYSCTEIRGEMAAVPTDPDCFAVPKTMFCEILDVDTLEPVEPGEAGLVVLTSLYPFQQVMPLIRYSMGDIAMRLGEDGAAVTLVKPIGRTSECLRIGQRQFLGPCDAFHAITHFADVPQLPYPRFETSLTGSTLRLDVEMAFMSGSLCTVTEMRQQMEIEIGRYGYPAECLPGEILCRFLPKNSLSKFPRIVPDR